jgi:hypothetical protein
VINTLAYYGTHLITALKRFIVQARESTQRSTKNQVCNIILSDFKTRFNEESHSCKLRCNANSWAAVAALAHTGL